ncbi:MAG: recJ2 [Lachnospiraceae bacterium]|jgi:single-stranded-DNA-specific exonuclease|nr:recJ2 [Lachnospiraceae bacterium]
MEKWVVKNKKADFKALMDRFQVSEVIARLLVNRNQLTPEEIESYLHPELTYLHNPFLMKDMDKACNLILKKIQSAGKIRIVGDYDVDGVSSTYILYTALLKCGANVDYEIPDRIKDGYGINMQIIEAAYQEGVDTLLTCDNGISAMDQVERAKELGMTVIITDHHDIPYINTSAREGKKYQVPKADAVINPKQPDCNYPWKMLCGAAVAYKLIQALYEKCNIPSEELASLLEIAAIATVCDVMDLVDENRIIVKNGLELLKETQNHGLRALMEASDINKSKLSAYHLGFIIGPCLNASGRLDSAKKGLRLLLAQTETEAKTLAKELKELNDIRKEMTIRGLEQAVEIVENSKIKDDKVLVVYLEDCHESLAGIIAGRLREKYNKPSIVLTSTENKVKGSCRSIEQYNIYEELSKCKDLLLSFGGHPMAAGLSLAYSQIDVLRNQLNHNTTLSEEDLIPKVAIDVVLPLGYVSEDLVRDLEVLEPFGKGNTKPIFAERNLKIRRATILGKNANVLKLQVVNEYGRVMDALYFGEPNAFLLRIKDEFGQNEIDKMFQNRENSISFSATYYPNINEYNGNQSIQIIIQNYQV